MQMSSASTNIPPRILNYLQGRADFFAKANAQFEQNKGKKIASVYQEVILPEIKKNGEDNDWNTETRQTFRSLIEIVVHFKFEEYGITEDAILEIGAGQLNADNRSYLASFFTTAKWAKLQWTFADLPRLAEKFKSSTVNYLPLDLTGNVNLPANAPRFRHIVGCNILDTIPYNQLPQALKKIDAMLEAGGVFMHIADMTLHYNAFLDACALGKSKVVFLPTFRKDYIYQIAADQYTRCIKKKWKLLNKSEREFFDQWAKYPPQAQASTFSEAMLKNIPWDTLCHKVHDVFEGHLTTISSMQLFENSLKAAAATLRWEVLKCDGTTVATLPDPAEPTAKEQHFDCLGLDNGIVTVKAYTKLAERIQKMLPHPPPYQEQPLIACVHVFAIRRLASKTEGVIEGLTKLVI